MNYTSCDEAERPSFRSPFRGRLIRAAATFVGASAAGMAVAAESFAPPSSLLDQPGIEVVAREVGVWVRSGPDCRKVEGSNDTVGASLNVRVKYQCTTILGNTYTIVCDAYDIECPPGRYDLVSEKVSEYRLRETPIVLFHDGEPVTVGISNLQSENGVFSSDLRNGFRIGEGDPTEDDTSVRTVGLTGYDIDTDIATGYVYRHGGGSVRLGKGPLHGIDDFDAGWISDVDLTLE